MDPVFHENGAPRLQRLLPSSSQWGRHLGEPVWISYPTSVRCRPINAFVALRHEAPQHRYNRVGRFLTLKVIWNPEAFPMSYEALLAISGYAFVTSISPGPSNFLLLASGANFGFARTIPQVLGITLGFTALLLAVGSGLGAILSAFPMLNVVLKIAGGVYLLYLAWRIGMSRSLGRNGEVQGRPLTFMESAALQWINPKAWIVAVTAMALFTDPDTLFLSVAFTSGVFAIVNLPSVTAWAGFGRVLQGFLSDPLRLKRFNVAMGVLLAATLWPMMQ